MPYPTCPICRDRGSVDAVETRSGSNVVVRQACSCARRRLVVRASRIGREWTVSTFAGVGHASTYRGALAAAGGAL